MGETAEAMDLIESLRHGETMFRSLSKSIVEDIRTSRSMCGLEADLFGRAADELDRLTDEVARLTAELAAAGKAIDDRGICERDVSAPLATRIDRLIVDLRTDRHHAETDALRLRADRDRLEAAVLEQAELRGRAEGDMEAIIRLCYHANEPEDGEWFYRLKVDPIDGSEMEIDYDTEAEAHAAVRAAAGLDKDMERPS